jgi:hypothetical protein
MLARLLRGSAIVIALFWTFSAPRSTSSVPAYFGVLSIYSTYRFTEGPPVKVDRHNTQPVGFSSLANHRVCYFRGPRA